MASIVNTNWNYEKPVKVSSNATSPGSAKVQPVILDGSKSEDNSGDNIVGYDTSRIDTTDTASKLQSIVFTESDGETTKAYEVENPDDLGTSNQVFVWVYDSDYKADGSLAFKLFIGGGDGTDYSVDGTGSNPWDNINSLRGRWHLNDIDSDSTSTDTVKDSTSNGFDGTTNNGPVSADGQFDEAASFDGTDDYISFSSSVNNFSLSDPFTIGFWYKTSQLDTDGFTMAGDTDPNNSYQGIRIDNGINNDNDDVNYAIRDSNGDEISTNSNAGIKDPDDTWRYYLFTYDGSGNASGLNIYIDGQKITTTTNFTDNLGSDISPSNNWILSGRSNGNKVTSGEFDEHFVMDKEIDSSYAESSYEASPKQGPSFFEVKSGQTTQTASANIYGKKKDITVTNKSGTPTVDKAQPLKIVEESGLYNVSQSSSNNSFDVSGEDAGPSDVLFNDNGFKMYVIGTGNDNIYSYRCADAYDITTATLQDSFDVSSQTSFPGGLTFNGDGSKMYIAATTDNIYEYNLSTSYDVSTAAFSQSLDVSGNSTDTAGVKFNSDGSKMFLISPTDDNVYSYNLSTGFDISTASFNQSFSISSQDSAAKGLEFNSDGSKMYITGSSSDSVYQYSLSTSFDISTASLSESFDISGQSLDSEGITWDSNGSKMYVIDSGADSVYSYFVGTTEENTTGTGDIVIDPTNVSSVTDLALYDENNNLLDFEVENPEAIGDETLTEPLIVWVYGSWVQDGTQQATLYYSDGPTENQENVTGTWNNTGQNTILVWHLNEDVADESSGTVFDSTSNNYNGNVSGTQIGVSSQFDGGADADGTDDYISTGQSGIINTDTDFTAVTWLKDPINSDTILLSKFDGSFDGFSLRYDASGNNEIQYSVLSDSGNSRVTVGKTVNDGNWHRTAISWNESNTENKGYTDLTSASDTTNIGNSQDGDGYFNVNGSTGGNSTPTGNYLGAKYDEIRLYSEYKNSDWHTADYDASPKGGQVFFSQSAATTNNQTSQVPVSTNQSVTPNPAVTAGATTITAITSSNQSVTPSPTLSPGPVTVNSPVSTNSSVTPNPTLSVGETITVPASNNSSITPEPSINAGTATITAITSTNQSVTPNPTITANATITAITSTNQSVTPKPTIQAGTTTISVQVSNNDSSTPTPLVNVRRVFRDASFTSQIDKSKDKTLSGDIDK